MSALDMWHLFKAARQRRQEQWHTPAQLARIRGLRLRRLAEVAYQTPYYRDVFTQTGLAPGDLTEKSLDALPVLDKAGLRSAGDRMLAEPAANLFLVNTSGSTGIPLQLMRNQRSGRSLRPCGRACLPPMDGGPSIGR